MSANAGGHPDRLLWYVAGRLDLEDARVVERHVARCPDCRREVDALRSMFRSIRAQARVDHVPAAGLLAYHDGDPALSETEARPIAEHLSECPDCAADLGLLERAARHERELRGAIRGAGAAPSPWSRLRVAAAAATILAAVGLAGWGVALREAEPAAAVSASRVVFAPSQRGLVAERRLDGPGPWEIEVLPPVLLAETAYTARIRRADGRAELLFEGRLAAASDGSVVLRGLRFRETGRYFLELAPSRDGGADVELYAFDVVRAR